jgi:hypothetical protein
MSWARIATPVPGSSLRAGDAALTAALALHSVAMNGGVFHALGVLSEYERSAACAGFRYYGLDDIAAVIEAAAAEDRTDESGARVDREYGDLDVEAILDARFRADFAARRDHYAP